MPKYYSCDEVAEMYGVKRFTILEWIRNGKLTAVRAGKNYRIRPEDIAAFDAANATTQPKDAN